MSIDLVITASLAANSCSTSPSIVSTSQVDRSLRLRPGDRLTRTRTPLGKVAFYESRISTSRDTISDAKTALPGKSALRATSTRDGWRLTVTRTICTS